MTTTWIRRRRMAGWILVCVTPCLLVAQMPVEAGRIASQLSGEREWAVVRGDLSRALAVERLVRLGLGRDRAGRVLEAVLASGADRALAEAVRVGRRADGRRTGTIDGNGLRAAAARLQQLLAASPGDAAALEEAVAAAWDSDVGGREDPAKVLLGLGYPAAVAADLARGAEETEWMWVDAGQAEMSAEVGAKVVGVNYKGLLVLIVPVLIVLAVALAAGADAAPFLAGAAAMGLIFVLFTDPAFLFGAGDGGD